ncbi:hypothetical protein TRAPUB_8586, partial [Trametes pubescens]
PARGSGHLGGRSGAAGGRGLREADGARPMGAEREATRRRSADLPLCATMGPFASFEVAVYLILGEGGK